MSNMAPPEFIDPLGVALSLIGAALVMYFIWS